MAGSHRGPQRHQIQILRAEALALAREAAPALGRQEVGEGQEAAARWPQQPVDALPGEPNLPTKG